MNLWASTDIKFTISPTVDSFRAALDRRSAWQENTGKTDKIQEVCQLQAVVASRLVKKEGEKILQFHLFVDSCDDSSSNSHAYKEHFVKICTKK